MSTPRQSGVRVLLLSNGVTSAERQCLGLLRALWPDLTRASADVQLLRVADWRSPAARLMRLLPAAVHVLAGSRFAGVDVAAIAAQADAAQREGLLTLLVACGRDTVAASVAVRAASRAVIAVQLLHPRVPLSAFDLCIVPAHDNVAPDARQVHRTLGVLHDLDAANLAAARVCWTGALSSKPRPLVACLVGAPTANCPYDCASLSRDVAALAADVERSGGCLSICPSRRTPPSLLSALRWAVMGVCSASFVPLHGEGNTYAGLLAWCDELVVTADSISMVSEAVSTGAGVSLLASDCARGKLRSFLDAMVASGAARPWTHEAEQYQRKGGTGGLREAEAAAGAVRAVLDARRAALTASHATPD